MLNPLHTINKHVHTISCVGLFGLWGALVLGYVTTMVVAGIMLTQVGARTEWASELGRSICFNEFILWVANYLFIQMFHHFYLYADIRDNRHPSKLLCAHVFYIYI